MDFDEQHTVFPGSSTGVSQRRNNLGARNDVGDLFPFSSRVFWPSVDSKVQIPEVNLFNYNIAQRNLSNWWISFGESTYAVVPRGVALVQSKSIHCGMLFDSNFWSKIAVSPSKTHNQPLPTTRWLGWALPPNLDAVQCEIQQWSRSKILLNFPVESFGRSVSLFFSSHLSRFAKPMFFSTSLSLPFFDFFSGIPIQKILIQRFCLNHARFPCFFLPFPPAQADAHPLLHLSFW